MNAKHPLELVLQQFKHQINKLQYYYKTKLWKQ